MTSAVSHVVSKSLEGEVHCLQRNLSLQRNPQKNIYILQVWTKRNASSGKRATPQLIGAARIVRCLVGQLIMDAPLNETVTSSPMPTPKLPLLATVFHGISRPQQYNFEVRSGHLRVASSGKRATTTGYGAWTNSTRTTNYKLDVLFLSDGRLSPTPTPTPHAL